jgi:hypothetical protein
MFAATFGIKEGAVSFPSVNDRTGVTRVGRDATEEANGGGGGATGIAGMARNVRFNLWESSPVVKYNGKINSTAKVAK